MKDNGVHEFFLDHKQTIEDKGFTDRLLARLYYLPAPESRVSRSGLIVSGFSAIGFLLFVLLGGYDVLLKAIGSMNTLFGDIESISPEVLVPVLFLFCSLFFFVKYALNE